MLTLPRRSKEAGAVDDQWFYAKDGHQNGPVTLSDLQMLASVGEIVPTDLVWQSGMPDWVYAKEIRAIFNPEPSSPRGMNPHQGEAANPPVGRPAVPIRPPRSDLFARKIAAGVCALLFGAFGIHKFILGLTGPGVVMFLVSVVGGIFTLGMSFFIMHVIGMIEGIIYLAKSDDDFYRDYIVNRRGWF